jgi:putative ABC transport system permease protein
VFGFLTALGVLTGLIALGGLLLYLEARQRARSVSFALASRMGLTRRAHRRSVALELGVMLAVGSLVGAVFAWVAARTVYGKLDPLPQLPPPPLFRTPFFLFGLTLAAVVAAAWVGAWRVQRTTERAHIAEVIRVAE